MAAMNERKCILTVSVLAKLELVQRGYFNGSQGLVLYTLQLCIAPSSAFVNDVSPGLCFYMTRHPSILSCTDIEPLCLPERVQRGISLLISSQVSAFRAKRLQRGDETISDCIAQRRVSRLSIRLNGVVVLTCLSLLSAFHVV